MPQFIVLLFLSVVSGIVLNNLWTKFLLYREKKVMNESDLENKIQEKNLDAPRLKPADIDAAIVKKEFYVFPGSQMTVCCLTLVNGFNTSGVSACASPENFNKEIGEDIAFKNAREQIWGLEGYLLKQKLHENS